MIRARLAELQLAMMLLTRLPVGPMPQNRIDLAQSAWAYPIAGLCVGICGATMLGLSALLGVPAIVAAFLCLLVMVLCSGGLHEDGLADLADGLAGGRDPEKTLAIMRDSRIGSYGVMALVFALGLRACAIAAVYTHGAHMAAAAVIALAMASRAQMTIWQHSLPLARKDGLGHAAYGVPRNAMVVALVYGALGLTLTGWFAPLVALSMLAGGTAVALGAKRLIGGQTGDVLGASQQCAEICGWLCLLALIGNA